MYPPQPQFILQCEICCGGHYMNPDCRAGVRNQTKNNKSKISLVCPFNTDKHAVVRLVRKLGNFYIFHVFCRLGNSWPSSVSEPTVSRPVSCRPRLPGCGRGCHLPSWPPIRLSRLAISYHWVQRKHFLYSMYGMNFSRRRKGAKECAGGSTPGESSTSRTR